MTSLLYFLTYIRIYSLTNLVVIDMEVILVIIFT